MAWWSWDLWRLVMSLHTNEGLNSWTCSFRFQGSSLCCHLIQNYQRGPEEDGPPAPAQELLVHFYSAVIQSVSCMTISVLIKPKRTRTDYSGQVRSARNDLYKLRIRKNSHPGYNLFQFLPLVGATEQLFTGHCLHVVSTKTSTTAFTETNHAVNTLWLYLYYTYSNSHNSLPPSIYRTSYPPLWIGYTCSSVAHCYCLFPCSLRYIESNKEHGIKKKKKNWAQFLVCTCTYSDKANFDKFFHFY